MPHANVEGQDCRPAKWSKQVSRVEPVTTGHAMDRMTSNWWQTGKSGHDLKIGPHFHATSKGCCKLFGMIFSSATVAALAYLEAHLECEHQVLRAELEDRVVLILELEDREAVLAELEYREVVLAELEYREVVLAELEDQVVLTVESLWCWAAPSVSCPCHAPAKALHMHHRPFHVSQPTVFITKCLVFTDYIYCQDASHHVHTPKGEPRQDPRCPRCLYPQNQWCSQGCINRFDGEHKDAKEEGEEKNHGERFDRAFSGTKPWPHRHSPNQEGEADRL